jgi:hypothetical protein
VTTLVTGALDSDGWTSWTQVRDLIGDDDCLWVDLRGAHHGRAPRDRPIGTHLWAWRPGRWVRVRIDGDRVLATVLTEDAETGERVTCVPTEGVPWGADARAAQWSVPVQLLVTDGPAPITFAYLQPRPA